MTKWLLELTGSLTTCTRRWPAGHTYLNRKSRLEVTARVEAGSESGIGGTFTDLDAIDESKPTSEGIRTVGALGLKMCPSVRRTRWSL